MSTCTVYTAVDLSAAMSHLDDLFADYPEHLTVPDVAHILGIQRSTVYKWLNEGTIPAYKVSSSWVILREELKERVASGRNLPREDDPEAPAPESGEPR